MQNSRDRHGSGRRLDDRVPTARAPGPPERSPVRTPRRHPERQRDRTPSRTVSIDTVRRIPRPTATHSPAQAMASDLGACCHMRPEEPPGLAVSPRIDARDDALERSVPHTPSAVRGANCSVLCCIVGAARSASTSSTVRSLHDVTGTRAHRQRGHGSREVLARPSTMAGCRETRLRPRPRSVSRGQLLPVTDVQQVLRTERHSRRGHRACRGDNESVGIQLTGCARSSCQRNSPLGYASVVTTRHAQRETEPLNAASIMWCRSRPRSTRRCTVARA